MKPFLSLPLLVVALAACTRDAAPATDDRQAAAAPFSVRPWTLPAAAVAAQPDLVATPAGPLLSWIEPQADGHELKFAAFAGSWSAPRTIARGGDWFVNWADTPHVARTDDGALWAHWLQKSAQATYAYDVMLVRSGDGGASWSAPVRVNNDGRTVEHGFVSLWPASRDSLGVAWLDGRDTAAGGEGHAGHASQGGAMTLRAARFDAGFARVEEQRLDATTCDCCQTDVALTARGPLLAYRDRTAAEIRDIAVVRQEGGTWSAPRIVHADQWTMPACPVNGPAVAARGHDAIVAWYTAAGEVPTLRLARSRDAGDRFGAPVTVDRGEAVQGRVDVAFDDGAAWVLWLREERGGQSLQLARYAADLSRELQRVEVAKLRGRGRGTGFPQLALSGGKGYVVWTDVVDGKPQLHGATVAR